MKEEKNITQKGTVDESAVYLQGESQGGLVSAIVGSRREADTKGLILWYPAFVIPDDAKKRKASGITTVFGVELSPKFDEAAVTIDIENIQCSYEKPVLLIHGDKDDLVPISYSRNALLSYKDARLEEIKGAGHGFEGADSRKARMLSVEFVKDRGYEA
ncbi:MAG: prolyl oligopeptidase family serine peptidase [Lachnospiraceae bacterium]|nr:prolyl oligopeptidase family serine peptidase [Lachnospiraceae bacterium]